MGGHSLNEKPPTLNTSPHFFLFFLYVSVISSEFGVPAFPNRRTIEYWLEDGHTSEAEKQKLRYSQSKSMQQHNKAGSHERRFAVLMSENFRHTSDFDEHIYNTQLLQYVTIRLLPVRAVHKPPRIHRSEALGYAYRVWRREWRGEGREYVRDVFHFDYIDMLNLVVQLLLSFRLRAPSFGSSMTVGQ